LPFERKDQEKKTKFGVKDTRWGIHLSELRRTPAKAQEQKLLSRHENRERRLHLERRDKKKMPGKKHVAEREKRYIRLGMCNGSRKKSGKKGKSRTRTITVM